MKSIAELLEKHEGFRQFPYRDTTGHLTIGIGRNIEERGITRAEALYLLQNDINDFKRQLSDRLYWFDNCNEQAQVVLIDMCFNLGLTGLLQFTKTLEHFKNENYRLASEEMLKSKWAQQVGERAVELSNILKEIK
jgi:lysozyme